MKNKLLIAIKHVPRHIWILAIIVLVGIFLRTYNFRDWLHFGNDQSRDAAIARDVAQGNASWPLLGSPMGNTKFRLGPIYNYFQIVSAKMFGTTPEKFAYPDLFFSILSIPLLYILLRKIFDEKLSLGLVGLYALSYYSIEYARFAWNSNPMPFFVILFVLALGEFLAGGVFSKWVWVVLLGVAIGVGSQLHAILLFIMGATIFVALVFSVKQNWKILTKWAVVFFIALIFNAPMIISDQQNGYANSKLFLNSFSDKSDSGSSRFVRNLQLNVACHAQANALILSSLSDKENCDFMYPRSRNVKPGGRIGLPWDEPIAMAGILVSFLLLFAGTGLIFQKVYQEKDQKKQMYFAVVAVFASVSFLVMLPIIDLAPMRYFIQVIFVPFVLLGLVLQYLGEKYSPWKHAIMLSAFAVLALANLYSICNEAKLLSALSRGDSGYIVLDEVQPLVDFMVEKAATEKHAYLLGGMKYLSPYKRTLGYLAEEQGLDLIPTNRSDYDAIPKDAVAFYVSEDLKDDNSDEIRELHFDSHLDVGNIGIYKLTK